MKKVFFALTAITGLFLTSCDSDDNDAGGEIIINNPVSYSFERDGESTVSFGGQTTRIAMAEEIVSAFKNETLTQETIDAMFAHVEGESDFSDADLNSSGKSVRNKTAASTDYYAANTTDANAIKTDFDGYIESQVADVFPNWAATATAGTSGNIQEAGGGSVRYVNSKGLELNQAFAKSLIGALMTDQILNNYLSSSVLDAGDNVANNDSNTPDKDGVTYTTMEHKWDEAYGYLYGAEENESVPVLGADSFLNKYLSRVEGDDDFAGIAEKVYNAFKLGRAAIVAKDYDTRDEQAEIIREKISLVIGVRASHYLQAGIANLGGDYASSFHDLSEGYGFVYSLQFTRKPNTTSPYFTKSEVDAYLATLMTGNGFWDVTGTTLQEISDDIASKFGFTSEAAAN